MTSTYPGSFGTVDMSLNHVYSSIFKHGSTWFEIIWWFDMVQQDLKQFGGYLFVQAGFNTVWTHLNRVETFGVMFKLVLSACEPFWFILMALKSFGSCRIMSNLLNDWIMLRIRGASNHGFSYDIGRRFYMHHHLSPCIAFSLFLWDQIMQYHAKTVRKHSKTLRPHATVIYVGISA